MILNLFLLVQWHGCQILTHSQILFITPTQLFILQNHCVQLLYKDKQIYLWIIFSSSVPEGQVACNPIYCRLLGLEEGCDVFVSPYNDVKILDELHIDTDSPDDQEILVSQILSLGINYCKVMVA